MIGRFTYMKAFLEPKTSSKNVGDFKFSMSRVIYHRIDETFFVTKSFIWRLGSPSGKMLFSFKIAAVLQSIISLVRSEVQVKKSQKSRLTSKKNSLFVCLRTLMRDRIVSIQFEAL